MAFVMLVILVMVMIFRFLVDAMVYERKIGEQEEREGFKLRSEDIRVGRVGREGNSQDNCCYQV